MQEQGTISVHTENLFPIIKKSLYSDREIFLRELISNGVDAINKLKWLGYREDFTGEVPAPKISITIDKEKRQLKITDSGIGMTADEVKKYINQVAFSGAEEFLEKYKKEGGSQPIIGHFGLGFYSSFMVSDIVEIDSKSYQKESQAVKWSCDGTTRFTISDSEKTETGTTITLTLTKDDDEYIEESRIKELIKKYCDFLAVPIELNGEVSNKQEPLWNQPPNTLKEEDYLQFFQHLYPGAEEPLFWIHLNTEYPVAVKGILYFPKLRADADLTRGRIKLFCDQVYVTDNADEVIPKFLVPLQGAIDISGNDIPLNVSRSYLHNDRKVARISEHIARKVADRLHDLHKDDFAHYAKVWPDISLFMKFGALNSDKFYQQIKDIFLFQTTKVEEGKPNFVTLEQYLERNKEKQDKTVYYAMDEVAQKSYIQLHSSQGLEVLILGDNIDTHFTSFLERENKELKFKRVDSELDKNLISEGETEIVDPNTKKTSKESLEELFKNALSKPNLTIKIQSLKSEAVPAMILISESMRRFREMSAAWQQPGSPLPFPEEQTLMVNTNSPLVKALQKLARTQLVGSEDTLPQLLCHHIYDLALMTQKSPEPATVQAFVARSNEVLTKLAERAS
jgi:molecular chaperone HtpG